MLGCDRVAVCTVHVFLDWQADACKGCNACASMRRYSVACIVQCGSAAESRVDNDGAPARRPFPHANALCYTHRVPFHTPMPCVILTGCNAVMCLGFIVIGVCGLAIKLVAMRQGKAKEESKIDV